MGELYAGRTGKVPHWRKQHSQSEQRGISRGEEAPVTSSGWCSSPEKKGHRIFNPVNL